MIRNEFEETIVEKPPEGWTLGHVTLDLHYPEDRIPVEAWRCGAFAVHRTVNGVRLTHAPTGMRIWTFATMDDAAMAAEKMALFCDWASLPAQQTGSELYPKVKAVCEKISPQRHWNFL